MQVITHEAGYKYSLPVFKEIEQFYTEVSDLKPNLNYTLVKRLYSPQFSKLADCINKYMGTSITPQYEDSVNVQSLKMRKRKTMIVCFSGGKDSIATALHYKNAGYKVHLYHLHNINPALNDEEKCAKEVAKYLEMPIHCESIKLSGYHSYTEHPMKNMIIASMALNYGIQNNIGTNIAFGNYYTSVLDDNVFDRCAGDCMDMWELYEELICPYIPDFKIHTCLSNLGQTLTEVCADKELLDLSVSCLCRHSLRPYRHNWVKTKFGVELPKHRCGSCYKCVVEYIYMADHDLAEFNRSYYEYCLNMCYNVCKAEGIKISAIQDIWNHFLFYPISCSKMYPDINNGLIGKGKIKWTTESITSVCK